MEKNGRKEVAEKALAVVDQARGLRVRSAKDYENAGEVLTAIKGIRKRIGEVFNGIIEKTHAAHKEAVKQKKEAEAPLLKAEAMIKPKIAEYNAEQERKAQEEERRLQAEAEKKAEKERQKEIAEAKKRGDKEEAKALKAEPVYVPPVVVERKVPKVEGVSIRQVWKFRIVNAQAIPRQYLIADEKALGQLARSLKERAQVPGVQFYPEDSVAAGAR